jgi:hypothetical protein
MPSQALDERCQQRRHSTKVPHKSPGKLKKKQLT